jgi:hypothetical protein
LYENGGLLAQAPRGGQVVSYSTSSAVLVTAGAIRPDLAPIFRVDVSRSIGTVSCAWGHTPVHRVRAGIRLRESGVEPGQPALAVTLSGGWDRRGGGTLMLPEDGNGQLTSPVIGWRVSPLVAGMTISMHASSPGA